MARTLADSTYVNLVTYYGDARMCVETRDDEDDARAGWCDDGAIGAAVLLCRQGAREPIQVAHWGWRWT